MDLSDLDRYQNLNIFELQALHSAYMGLAEESASEMVMAADVDNTEMVEEATEENETAMERAEVLFKLLHETVISSEDD
jgi:hypothetical protein